MADAFDRELILATLACLLCGPALVLVGAIPSRLRPVASARMLEHLAWRRLWMPVIPAAVIFAFLIGWALQEPEDSEAVGLSMFAIGGGFACVALRALVRAGRAARSPADPPMAMTTGLWRPRIVIAPALAAHLDDRALDAAIAHEAAHVRHRDPLRLWLAQIATDLQWPAPAARQRFADWRHALELARDAEACERVDGSDLATALIEAARLSQGCRATAALGLVSDAGGAAAFSDRIYRLLDAVPQPVERLGGSRRWATRAALAGVLGAAIATGEMYGEAIVNVLHGITS
jgi:hypothetical protein